jgi:hypothetical protein
MKSGYVPAVLFTTGVLAALAALFTTTPWLYLLAGPCFVVTGALSLWGFAADLKSPLGSILASLVGSSRVRYAKLRMWAWIAIGLWLIGLGIHALNAPPRPVEGAPSPEIALSSR